MYSCRYIRACSCTYWWVQLYIYVYIQRERYVCRCRCMFKCIVYTCCYRCSRSSSVILLSLLAQQRSLRAVAAHPPVPSKCFASLGARWWINKAKLELDSVIDFGLKRRGRRALPLGEVREATEPSANNVRDDLHTALTRVRPAGVAAHSVGHHVQPKLVIDQIRVFVMRPNVAHVRQWPGENPHSGDDSTVARPVDRVFRGSSRKFDRGRGLYLGW